MDIVYHYMLVEVVCGQINKGGNFMRSLIFFGLVVIHLLVVYFLVRDMKNKNALLGIAAASISVYTVLKFMSRGFINNANVEFFANFPLTLLILIMYIPIILGAFNKFRNYTSSKNTTLSKNQILLGVTVSLLVFVGMFFLAIWQNIFLYWW